MGKQDIQRLLNGQDITECKVKYRYLTDDSDEPLQIASNYGVKKHEKAYVSRDGEYHGFCVEALEDIPSILTNRHVRD